MNILKIDYNSRTAGKELAESFRTTGFAVITRHPISGELIQKVYDDWKEFFNSDEKNSYLFDKKTQAGFFPFKTENAKGFSQKDLKEFFHIYPRNLSEKVVSAATRKLHAELTALAVQLLTLLEEATPAEIRSSFSMPLQKMIEGSEQTLFRILHYPPLKGDESEGAIRAAAHEDINLITLLPASTQMGLQVKDLAGNWINVEGSWGDIVINVGDMLQMASQGYYRSTSHQVVNPVGEAARLPRYSMPLFLHPRPDVRLSSTHTADDYLNERLREIGLK